MKPGDLSTGAAKLNKSWKKLRLRWEETAVHWQDQVSRDFEENYLAPLEPQITKTLERMRSLAAALTAAQNDCDH